MATFPSKVFKISLSEISLLRGLHAVASEGSGVLVLVSKSSDGLGAQSRKGFLCVCEHLWAEMFQLFATNSTQHLSSVLLLLVWANRLQCPRAL